ncbi:glutathione S-transferase-like [Sipha flava]|uniref:glutathione transferase n=1 Tax=Sipha flava TaxID=143950 RepID=A0A2S2R8M3_9HEMI|nr:LOW QUALITY PROTEIN: glutathione S-transferase-like [Sipha flava]XP_025408606.1 LOW QUALITY PROTEIN: glutathione S-transferase-like [Sipha flava]XP_025408608.1 glutathione S-transferase-like [Sipha flava]XP_025408610.1 glutathione S-transferase-like [Sipha flava]
MSSYKVTYFDITALAEPIRFLLSYLNIDFEDFRFDKEQWPSIKPTMPFGKVPVVEIDGKVLNQSTAICRYLSKKAGLAGSDDWESMLIDIAVDNVHDLRQAIASYKYDPLEESKKTKYEPLIKETIPFYMDKFEKIVGENNGYFVNGKLTWADLFFVAILDYLNFMAEIDLLEGRPNMQALKKKVLAVPQIKTWVEKRPTRNP